MQYQKPITELPLTMMVAKPFDLFFRRSSRSFSPEALLLLAATVPRKTVKLAEEYEAVCRGKIQFWWWGLKHALCQARASTLPNGASACSHNPILPYCYSHTSIHLATLPIGAHSARFGKPELNECDPRLRPIFPMDMDTNHAYSLTATFP